MEVSNVLNALPWGIIGAITFFFLKDRRRIKNANNKEEQVIPLEVRATKASTFETEMLAMQKSFDQDRANKDNTIRYQAEEIVTLRSKLSEKDQKINDLESQVDNLKAKVRSLQEQLVEMADSLERMTDEINEVKAKEAQ